jgi:hypothetical protein
VDWFYQSWKGVVINEVECRSVIELDKALRKSRNKPADCFSGRLEFITNKKDFDFNIQLFELMPGGEYIALSYHRARASYVGDRSRRRLLVPGRRQSLDFESGFFVEPAIPYRQQAGYDARHRQTRRHADQLQHRTGCQRRNYRRG